MIQILFCAPALYMSDKAQTIVERVGYWYLLEYGTYIKVYEATKYRQLLPKFVPDKLVLQEIGYQTLVYRVGATLKRDK